MQIYNKNNLDEFMENIDDENMIIVSLYRWRHFEQPFHAEFALVQIMFSAVD